MKLHKISLARVLGLGALTSCDSKLDVTNPNQPTAEIFGHNVADLEEAVIACYNHIRNTPFRLRRPARSPPATFR